MKFHPAIKLTTTLLLTFLLSACALPFGPAADTPTPSFTLTPEPPTATPVPAIATVNGEAIPLAEYQAELARYKSAQSALGRTVTDEDAANTVLEDLIAQFLLSQGARAVGLGVTDADLQSRVEALVASLGSADALAAWESAHGYDDASFRIALKRDAEAALMRDTIVAGVSSTVEQVHAREILFYNAESANFVLNQLKAGGDFDGLAAQYNRGAQAETNGDLGWFPRGYLLEPAIEEAAFALQPGQFSEVIQTEVGFHIVLVIERGSHLLSPDALMTLQAQAVRDWVSQQRAQAQIVRTP